MFLTLEFAQHKLNVHHCKWGPLLKMSHYVILIDLPAGTEDVFGVSGCASLCLGT